MAQAIKKRLNLILQKRPTTASTAGQPTGLLLILTKAT
jgi:hypothetical protein